MNPVTGKKWVTTWMADTLIHVAKNAYEQIGAELGVNLIKEYELLTYHPTAESHSLFEARIEEDDRYLYEVNNEHPWDDLFHFPYDIGGVGPCYVVDVQLLLSKWREELINKKQLIEEEFTWADCEVAADSVLYKNIEARKLICCDGVAGEENPYFRMLPFQLNKGEAVIASISGLPATNIYKHGVMNMVPWKEGLFWIGSIFDREYTDDQPTNHFKKQVEETLARWLKVPYEIVDHMAALRPATGGQKPFVGLHPVHKSVGILNGMGSKGCSMAPTFANELTNHLLHGTSINPEASIDRFQRILSRNA